MQGSIPIFNYLIIDQAVCKTFLATSGLLTMTKVPFHNSVNVNLIAPSICHYGQHRIQPLRLGTKGFSMDSFICYHLFNKSHLNISQGSLQSFRTQKALQNLYLKFNLIQSQNKAFYRKIQLCPLYFKWHLENLCSPYLGCAMTVTLHRVSKCHRLTVLRRRQIQLTLRNFF